MSGEEERPWTVVSLSRGQKRRSKRTAMKKQLYATDPGANNNNSNHNNYQSTDDYDDNNNNNYNYSDNKYNTTPTSGTTTSSTIGSDTKEKEEKRMRLRKNVLEEIVNTEIAYIDSLYTLMIYYITPLRNSERFPELSSSPKGDVKVEIDDHLYYSSRIIITKQFIGRIIIIIIIVIHTINSYHLSMCLCVYVSM